MSESFFTPNEKVSTGDLIVFFRKMQIVFHHAFPVITQLKLLALDTSNNVLREAILDMEKDFLEGASLTQIFEKHDNIFSPVTIALINAGEETGSLTAILGDIVLMLQTEKENQ